MIGSDPIFWVALPARKAKVAEPPVSRITDPSVATDEQNNEEVYRAMSPGVVNITTTMEVRDLFYAYQQEGSGSGSVLDKEGHILTNFHVVRGASEADRYARQ